jgi:ArsR family transcriptional regulator
VSDCYENAKIFTAFCDETRLKVIGLLKNGEKSFGVLLKQVNVSQSTLSHHMKILVESGIVTLRKVGKWSYYSICESSRKKTADLIEELLTLNTFEYYGLLDLSIKYKLKDSKSMKSFSIMVDTSSDIPSEYLKEQEIETIPITFELDGNPHNK